MFSLRYMILLPRLSPLPAADAHATPIRLLLNIDIHVALFIFFDAMLMPLDMLMAPTVTCQRYAQRRCFLPVLPLLRLHACYFA